MGDCSSVDAGAVDWEFIPHTKTVFKKQKEEENDIMYLYIYRTFVQAYEKTDQNLQNLSFKNG